MIDTRLQTALDQHEINTVLVDWGHCRDGGEWAAFADLHHPGAAMDNSFLKGTVEEFIAHSKVAFAGQGPEDHFKHMISGARIMVAGDRAFSRCHVNLLARANFDGLAFECETWGLFYDLLDRRDDQVWRICDHTMVYEKDRVEPIQTDQVPPGYFDEFDLSHYPMATRWLNWRQLKRAKKVPRPDVIIHRSEEEKALTERCLRWLKGD